MIVQLDLPVYIPWKIERVIADGNGAAAVEDNGCVVGGDWGDRGSLVGCKEGKVSQQDLSIGHRSGAISVEVFDYFGYIMFGVQFKCCA